MVANENGALEKAKIGFKKFLDNPMNMKKLVSKRRKTLIDSGRMIPDDIIKQILLVNINKRSPVRETCRHFNKSVSSGFSRRVYKILNVYSNETMTLSSSTIHP